MVTGLALVSFARKNLQVFDVETTCRLGWYDSIYDVELGSQPCIFTSVTPVRHHVHKGLNVKD